MKNQLIDEPYPGIFKITERGVLGLLKPPVHIYFITGKNGLVYDAGYGNISSINKFSKAFKEVNNICRNRGVENHIDRILLSHAHADHFSGLNNLRKRCGFRIILTQEMKEIVSSGRVYKDSFAPPEKISGRNLHQFPVYLFKRFVRQIEFAIYSFYWGISFIDDPDILINSESSININDNEWEIFSSPGHSSDHITLYNRELGILFSGDNVLKSINVWLGPPKSDLDQYENSIKRMLKLPGLKIILPAHGSPITNPYKRLTEIIEWRKKRTDDVSKIILNAASEGVTIGEILGILYPSDSRMKKGFAEGWIELTLNKLLKEKLIFHNKDRYYNISNFQQ